MPDGHEFPDPASRYQPDGVHGASAAVDTRAFEWNDANFAGHSLPEFVVYELHVGTFTEEGTFAAAISRLDALAELGITAVELMPVAQFPGTHNWGYDGVYPFAAQNSYGGPAGLQQFVNAAHARGMSVVLDVVYNHLGPEGNYFGQYGPFFTKKYSTPWGEAINFDGADSEPVRAFFIQNALYWLREFHIDALRLDAVHGIFDFGAHHILAEIKERVRELSAQTGRQLQVIAESDLNDARLLHTPSTGGYGLDAQWSDDFHHALHTLLTHESNGYYEDFGALEDLCVAMREGWRYSGQYSKHRRRRHGNSPEGILPRQFLVCSQNHDQVGNRAAGERLAKLVDFESLKLAASVTLLSPFVPLLFMGEEYGETHPFQYFTSHSDADLIEAVRRGRREEFVAFGWSEDVPDPQDEATFKRSTLNYAAKNTEPHRTLWNFYQRLIGIRKRFALGALTPTVRCDDKQQTLTLEYHSDSSALAVAFHFGNQQATVSLQLTSEPVSTILNSSDTEWRGADTDENANVEDGSFVFGPRSCVVFKLEPMSQEQ
jgi:maltooligosyltrehalose trehalohydrolase